LALKLGIPHPDHLQAILSPRQIDDWMNFYAVEPWGAQWDNMLMGRQAWATAQVQTKKRLKEQAFQFRLEQQKPLTPEQYRAKHMAAMECWQAIVK
jgi:hypothetical protein